MKEKNDKFKLVYAFFLAGQLGFFIIIPIIGLLFFGKWLDSLFKTGSFFLSGGIFSGVIIAIHGVYRFLLPLIKN